MKEDLFEDAPIKKAYFTLALPVVFSMVVSLVYNMVDTFFIAQTQNTDLVAGVSLCAPVFTLMIALGDIFGLGGSSVISRLFGQKKDEDGKRVSGFCFYAALICGVVVTVLMLILQDPIMTILGVKEATRVYAGQYYFYLALGAPAIILSFTPSNLLRTEGLAIPCMIGTMVGTIVNIVLDPVLILGFHMGAAGAAIATVIANIIGDLVLIYFVIKKSEKLTVSCKNIKVSKEEILSIFAIGIPASITNLMQSFGIAFTNRYLLTYGTQKVAAMGIAMKVDMIVVLVLVGFAFGAQPLVGYNYGAKNIKRMQEVIRFSLKFQIAIAVGMSAILAIFSPVIIKIFMNKEEIITAGSLMLRCYLISTPFIGIVLVFTTVFQSAGKALYAFLLSLSRQGVIFAICMIILSKLAGYMGVITAQAIADLLTAMLAIGLYIRFRKEDVA